MWDFWHSLFIFIISFSDFSIPMILWGGGTTLEILIYEKEDF